MLSSLWLLSHVVYIFYHPDLFLLIQICLSLSRHFIQISHVSFCTFSRDFLFGYWSCQFDQFQPFLLLTFLIYITKENKVDTRQFRAEYTKLPDIDSQTSLIILALHCKRQTLTAKSAFSKEQQKQYNFSRSELEYVFLCLLSHTFWILNVRIWSRHIIQNTKWLPRNSQLIQKKKCLMNCGRRLRFFKTNINLSG